MWCFRPNSEIWFVLCSQLRRGFCRWRDFFGYRLIMFWSLLLRLIFATPFFTVSFVRICFWIRLINSCAWVFIFGTHTTNTCYVILTAGSATGVIFFFLDAKIKFTVNQGFARHAQTKEILCKEWRCEWHKHTT
jgi:hypothetical protein